MRIKDLLSPRIVNSKITTQSSKTSDGVASFSMALNEKETDMNRYTEEIAQLKNEIETAGDNLEQEPNLQNFKKFRDLLSQLAKRVNTEAYRLEKIEGTPQNPRYFEIIRIINSDADKLYKLILSEQRNRLAIIEKVIGIKGLVVNLLT